MAKAGSASMKLPALVKLMSTPGMDAKVVKAVRVEVGNIVKQELKGVTIITGTTKNQYISKFNPLDTEIQSVYSQHPDVFGFNGKGWNKENAQAFKRAMIDFINSSNTDIIIGSYRGNDPAIHFLNRNTRQVLLMDPATGSLKTSWILSEKQMDYLLNTGNFN